MIVGMYELLFLEALNRHAPIIDKSLKHNSFSWINSSIKKLIRSRDFHKNGAKKYNSQIHRDKYKLERNAVNLELKKAKTVYYKTKITSWLK